MKAFASRIWIVLLSTTLAGCIVVPLSEKPSPYRRQNITDEVPAFIVAGVTTRADVLLRLGEPDGASAHELQFTYTKGIRTGGVAMVMCAATGCLGGSSEKMAYDRLTIQFDDKNVVSSFQHERIACSETDFGNNASGPCANVSGQDLLLKQINVADGVVFPRAVWCRGTRWKWWQVLPKDCLRGNLVISNLAILLYSNNADSKSAPTLALPYTEIASVDLVKDIFSGVALISLKRPEGDYDSVTVTLIQQNNEVIDNRSTKSAGELLLSRWRTAPTK